VAVQLMAKHGKNELPPPPPLPSKVLPLASHYNLEHGACR
jgi:hypothetical protein